MKNYALFIIWWPTKQIDNQQEQIKLKNIN
jgi:hypothetical protein